MDKADTAFRTIGEVSDELGVAQHVLRYWETRFPQLRPLQRAGNRRYYRPADVMLVRRIHTLLNEKGYTIRGVQQLLATKEKDVGAGNSEATEAGASAIHGSLLDELEAVRAELKAALAE